MKISSNPINYEVSQRPQTKEGTVLLKYDKPSISETAIGQIPKDGEVAALPRGTSDILYDDSFRPNDSLELSGYRRIYSEEPYLKNGKPVFKEARELVELGPKSGIKESLLGGLGGTLAGAAAAAAVVGLGIVAAPVGLAAAAALGVGGALLAGSRARREVRELSWGETPILSRKLEGFRQTVSSRHVDYSGPQSRTGTVYSASYQPLTTTVNNGSWMKPVVVTRKGS